MAEPQVKSIWYFVGLILLVMGGIVFCSGLYQLVNPPTVKTVLSETHPNIWWGALMVIFGGVLFLKVRKQASSME
jgi:FtsH-binding integral membrane protein